VVGHLEHVRSQVGPAAPEAGLGFRAEIAGEQDRQSARLGPDDQGQIVRRRSGRRQRRIRSEHVQRHRADRAPVTRNQGQPLRARPVHEGGETGHPVVGG
jgi:hypothetical protein